MLLRILFYFLFSVLSMGLSHEVVAATYTCTEVDDKATLTYSGGDTVTDNHSDKNCSWTIGTSNCSGCYRPEWRQFQTLINELATNAGYSLYRDRSIKEFFPAMYTIAQERLGVDLSNVDLDEFSCDRHDSYGDVYLDYDNVGFNASIACIVFEPGYNNEVRIGNTLIQTANDLLIISVKGSGWDDGEITTYVTVPR